MKKFISLFVIAAVLAFAGMAFAADGDISAFAINTADRGNVGGLDQTWAATTAASMDVKANLYYAPVDVAAQSIVAKFSATGASSITKTAVGSSSASAAATISPDQLGQGVAVTPTLAGTLVASTPAVVTYTIPGVNLSKIPAVATAEVKGIGGYDSAGFAKSGLDAFANVTLNLTPVKFSVEGVSIDTSAKSAKATLVADAGGADVVIAATANIECTVAGGTTGITTAELSSDLKTIDITIPTTLKPGKATISVAATNAITVSEDAANQDIAIAGLDSTAVKVTEFVVDVTIAPTNKTDKTTYTFIVDQAADVVVSTDMVSTDIKSIQLGTYQLVNSADIVASADVTGGTLLTFSSEGLSKLFASITADTTFDLNIADDADLTKATKLAKASVVVSPKPVDHSPVATPTASDDRAIAMIVASADVFGLTSANSVDANLLTAEEVQTLTSNDLKTTYDIDGARAGMHISIPVAAKDQWVAITKNTFQSVPSQNGLGVYFVKRFLDATGDKFAEYQFPHDLGTESKDSQGRLQSVRFNATLLVVNGTAPKAVRDMNGYQKGTADEQGLIVQKTTDGQYAVVIYDGDPTDGEIFDPIYAKNASSHSSSSSCDLGFGLIAVAGLAALALRKRSK